MKRQNNKHHLIPRSRLHCSKRTVELPTGFHNGLHIVFGNLYSHEMVIFIKEVNRLMKERSKISGKELEAIRDQIKEGRISENS